MQGFEIRLLGPPLVRLGKDFLSLGPKAAALVAYLAVEGSSSRERVLGQLWPDSSQKKAQGSLRYLLHSLRKSVSDLIESDTQALTLNSGARVDIRQLSQAETPAQRAAAAELFRGHFCEGLQGGSPEFDDWLEKQRAHWEQTVVENLLQLARLLEPREGLKPARRAVLMDPLNEAAHATVIELLMRSGETAEAHRQFERCREVLASELGVDPSVATTDLLAAPASTEIRSNLPASVVRLLGREESRKSVFDGFASHRVVTLTGEGGIGKTTLALAVARMMREGRNVWWVELARLRETDDLPKEVALACGVREGERLEQHLARGPALLLLDNCEHVLHSTAGLSERLLRACEELKILATSREPLRLESEMVVCLDPLEVPPEGHPDCVDFAAVRLFRERALQSGASEEMLADTAGVARICRKLDGLPLAIELAAARARTLPLDELQQGLEQRFRFLKNRKPTAESRQQTLFALIDWSYQRLEPEDREAFRKLSVFRDGFYSESAAELLDLDRWETADTLERLVEKSLLRTRPQGGGIRYYFLESLREFGASKLDEWKEQDCLKRRHLELFTRLAQSLCPLTKGQQQRVWLDRLDSELGNFRAALQYAATNAPSAGLELAAALCPLWKDRDHREEGLETLNELLELSTEADPEWPRGLLLKGELEVQLGRCRKSLESLEVSLRIGREREDCQITARAAKGLGTAHFFLRDFELSIRHFEKAKSEYEALQDPYETANCINNLGLAELYRGNLEVAEAHFESSFDLHAKQGSMQGEGIALGNRAYVAQERGDIEAARTLFYQALDRLHRVGALWNSAYFLEGLARTLKSCHCLEEAVRCLAVADGMRRRLGTPRLPVEEAGYTDLAGELRELVGTFDEIWGKAVHLQPATFLDQLLV